MSDRFLQGRQALVTGSTSGIGLAIATALAGAGARLALHGLGDAQQVADARAAVSSAGNDGDGEVRHFGADLRDPAAITEMLESLIAGDGLDILVNCAGMQHAAPIAEMPPERWDMIIAVNLSAAFHTMRLALPGMAERGYGRVVNIASVHGLVASVDKAPYVASKFGMLGLSKVAALEYARSGDRERGGVTVNCICPGWVETALIEPQILRHAGGDSREKGIARMLADKQPSQRTSQPSEIADAVIWLCRPQAHNLTGASIPIDGGWTAQ